MSELRFEINAEALGDMTLGDLESLESGRVSDLVRVLANVIVGGADAVRGVKVRDLRRLGEAVGEAAKQIAEGKN